MAITVGELEAKLHADVSSFVSGMRQATQSFQQTQKAIGAGTQSLSGLNASLNTIQGSLNKLSGNMNKVFGAIGAGFILPKIFMAAKSAVIDFNQQVDQATVALTNFLGSGTEAKKMIGDLQDFAARTPFQFKDLLGTTQSMMAMGVAAEDVLPRMQAIGDAAAAMGGSPEVLYRIQRALGQIQAKGRVQSEELLQLAEAGIPAYQYMADALGTTTAEMLNDMRKGTVDATTAITAILDGMSRDFGGMMEEQSKTMMGAMSTVMDYVQITVGALFRPLFEALRDSFVALSELLSSEAMKNAASNFAKGVASVISSIRSLITAFASNLKKPFLELVQAIGKFGQAAIRVITALKPMAMAVVMPLALAFIAVSKAVVPIISGLASLAELLTRNQVVMYALAGLLMGKMLMGWKANHSASTMFGNAITKVFKSMGSNFTAVRWQFQNMRDQGVGTFAALRMSSGLFAAGMKAVGVAIGTALIQLLPLTVAFMAVGKLMQAFSDRNKDAKARTEELTAAIKEQTDAILAQEDALARLASAGLDPLNDALRSTGKEGEETTNAIIALGKSGDDYVSIMRDFKKDTEGAAYSLAKARGFTDEQARAMANYVKTYDKGKDSFHRGRMELIGFDEAMIKATMNLEQLDDASENTNFVKMTTEIINATIRSNEAAQSFLDQAEATVKLAEEQGKKMSADERAIAVYEEFIRLSGEFAKITDEVATSVQTAADRILYLAENTKEGKIEMEAFRTAFLGIDEGAVTASRGMFEMGRELGDLNDSIKETKGDAVAFQSVGYDFADMFFSVGANIQNMGGTLGDVQSAMTVMIQNFTNSAIAAGYTKEEVDKLLGTLGVLKGYSEVTVRVDADVEAAKQALLAIAQAMKLLGGSAAKFRQYEEAEAKLLALQSTAKKTLPALKAINAATKGGGSKGESKEEKAAKKRKARHKELRKEIAEVYEDALARAKERIDEATQAQEEYAKSISDTIRGMASLSSAYDTIEAGNKRILDAVKNALVSLGSFTDIINDQTAATNALTQAQKGQTEAQSEVNDLQKEQLRLLAKYRRATSREEQLEIQDELARNTEALTRAEEKLAEAKKATADAEKEQVKTGKSFLEGLRLRAEAAKNFASKLGELRNLGLNEKALSQIVSAGADVGGQMADELIAGARNGLGSITETNKLVDELESLGETVGSDIANSFYNAGVTGASATLNAMMTEAEKARLFAEKIKTLVAMGLSQENLQNVLDAGVSAGSKIADQLIGGGVAAINQANSITTALKDAADSAARAAGSKYYDAGVAFANNLYNGLKTQWDTLKPQLKNMTIPELEALLAKAKVELPKMVEAPLPTTPPPIMTPPPPPPPPPPPQPTFTTQVENPYNAAAFMALGQAPTAAAATGLSRAQHVANFLKMVNNQFPSLKANTLQEYFTKKNIKGMAPESERRDRWADYVRKNNVPALADGGIVNRATLALIGEAGPEAVIPLSKMGDGGTTINLHVSAGMGADGTQIGQKIVNELIAWQRRNGALPVRVQS